MELITLDAIAWTFLGSIDRRSSFDHNPCQKINKNNYKQVHGPLSQLRYWISRYLVQLITQFWTFAGLVFSRLHGEYAIFIFISKVNAYELLSWCINETEDFVAPKCRKRKPRCITICRNSAVNSCFYADIRETTDNEDTQNDSKKKKIPKSIDYPSPPNMLPISI